MPSRSRPARLVVLSSMVLLCASGVFARQRPPGAVDLTAPDGLALKATFFPASAPGPGVLLLHQCNRQRKVWDALAQDLSAAGIHVLTLDYRGYGESSGERFDALPQAEAARIQQEKWPGDIDAAFAYLIAQPGVKKDTIGVGGASCGVQNSVQTARRHPEVKSLVLLSGATDLNGRAFLRTAKLPVFFSFADDDEFQPTVLIMQWLYSLTGTPQKTLARFANGGHGSDMFPVQKQLPKQITDWYVQTLIKTPGHAPANKDRPRVANEIEVLNTIDQPGGAATVTRKLDDARKRDPKAQLFPEELVNFVGYEHLQSGDIKGAVAIMQLNARAYPASANVYDSLGDAYLADGQTDLARENAEKALAMLKSDTSIDDTRRAAIRASAEGKLKQLGPRKAPREWNDYAGGPDSSRFVAATQISKQNVFGGYRRGDNLFSDSLLALDARTGTRLWHFQTVHHDIWDLDNNSAPQLTTITHDGRSIDIAAAASKTGYLYVFDRVSGKPIWPIEERAVPQTSTVPGQLITASPVQPSGPGAVPTPHKGPTGLIAYALPR